MLGEIFIVVGQTGAVEDWRRWDGREWDVVAYSEEEMAILHMEKANTWLREHDCFMDDIFAKQREDDSITAVEPKDTNPYDRGMEFFETGIRYKVKRLPFMLHLDQYLE